MSAQRPRTDGEAITATAAEARRRLNAAEAAADFAGSAGTAEWPAEPARPGVQQPDPLPLEFLPAVLRNHVVSVAGATQTPADMAAMLALAAVSAATRGRFSVSIDARGWNEVATIYTACVLPPASRKSPVYAAMVAPIEKWEREERERISPAHTAAKDRANVCRAALEKAKQDAARGKATQQDVSRDRKQLTEAEQEIPVMPRVVVSNATPERLVQLLSEQGGALAVMGPEADPLGIADGKYSDTARIDELLRAHVGEPITVDRVGREANIIPRAVLTVATAMQPQALRALRHGDTHRGRGLWARVLWCVPPHGLGGRLTGRDVPPMDSMARVAYAEMIRRLLANGSPTDTTGLRLAEDARDVLYRYEAEIEAGLGDGGTFESIRDWAGKAVGQAVRMATLMALARRAAESGTLEAAIRAEDVQGGVAFARALTTHARVILAGIDPGSPSAQAAYVLRRAIEIGPGTTLRDLHRATGDRPGLAKMEDLEPVVKDLIDRGCLRLVTEERPANGRPPSPIVELHPTLSDGDRQPGQNRQNPAFTIERVGSVSIVGVSGGSPAENGDSPEGSVGIVGVSGGSPAENEHQLNDRPYSLVDRVLRHAR